MSDTLATSTPGDVRTLDLRWGGTFEDSASSLKAGIFGEMVKLATPVITQYHGDLFHDAVWINSFVTGTGSWYFVARPGGTHIGVSRELVTYAASLHEGAALYRLELVERPRQKWQLLVTTLETPALNTIGRPAAT